MKFKLFLILQCVLLLSACVSTTQHSSEKYPNKESQACDNFFTHLDQKISIAGVVDSESTRISNYPYLRINRFLSDFRHDQMDATMFHEWIDHMQHLGEESWQIEFNNLPSFDKEIILQQVNSLSVENMNFNGAIHYCGKLLRASDFDEDEERRYLKTLVNVPDEYETWQRVIGLYPITALAFRSSINSWHNTTNKIYTHPLELLTVQGELLRYSPSINDIPLSSIAISNIIKKSINNTLNIPELSASDIQKLFDSFAPTFEIDVVTDNDQIGTMGLDHDGMPRVNTETGKVYQQLSYTRMSNQILLQLNYTIWFPSRPKTSAFDMLGGHLDGITWRVTLLPNGKPLLFDSIHNCGCYHLFFPTQHANILPQTLSLEEPAFIPQTVFIQSTDKPVIRIASGTHYIERIYFDDTTSTKLQYYETTDSKELRSLALNDDKYRSLFGQDGIVNSSKRGERYLFWPMGIPNPGAMRQWGHHATAFVGRRHFDDARLFEKYFSISTEN